MPTTKSHWLTWLRLVVVGAAATLPDGLGAANSILRHFNEMHLMDADKISYQGQIKGMPLSVILHLEKSASKSFLIAEAVEGSSPATQLKLDVTDFSHLDFTQPGIFAEEVRGRAKVLIEMRYGDARDCYVNDTGRDRLTIVLEAPKGSHAYVESFAGCTVTTRDLIPS